MKKAILLVCLLAMGGCARLTIPGQLASGPVAYRLSEKTPEQYVRCWGGFGPGLNDSEEIGEGGLRLYRMTPGTYGVITDATPHEGGSKISYYTRTVGGDRCL